MVLLENDAVSCTNDVVPIPPLTSNFGDHKTYFTHSYILAGKENCFHFFSSLLQFLTGLTKLFQQTRGSGSVFLTMKKCQSLARRTFLHSILSL